MATVIARPSLEWCVIDAGRIAFGESSVLRITAPQGATVLHSTADSTTLTLLGESRDLRIGDTVRLVMNAPDQLLVQNAIPFLTMCPRLATRGADERRKISENKP